MKLYLTPSISLISTEIIMAALKNKPINLKETMDETILDYLDNIDNDDIIDGLNEDDLRIFAKLSELTAEMLCKQAKEAIKKSCYKINDVCESECGLSWYDVDLEIDLSKVDYLSILEKEAIAYEQGKMLRDDSEVEIDVTDGEVWICDYSPNRQGSELIKKICDNDDISFDDVEAMCNKHGWSYVF